MRNKTEVKMPKKLTIEDVARMFRDIMIVHVNFSTFVFEDTRYMSGDYKSRFFHLLRAHFPKLYSREFERNFRVCGMPEEIDFWASIDSGYNEIGASLSIKNYKYWAAFELSEHSLIHVCHFILGMKPGIKCPVCGVGGKWVIKNRSSQEEV